MSHREEFNRLLKAIIQRKASNNVYISKKLYREILEFVKTAKLKFYVKTTHVEYRRLKRYDVITVGEESKLISKNNRNTNIRYFVAIEELFDVIDNVHLSLGHGGQQALMKELNLKYKNVTLEAITLYLSLCKPCQQKLSIKHKHKVIPAVVTELDSRCQVDIIDLQLQPDNEFKFIMNYQDHLTKFVILRPLKTKTAVEVAEHLLNIFTLFGAPSILQSDIGRKFCNAIITELTRLWDGIKIVHGKPRHCQTQNSVEIANQEVQNMLSTWVITNKSTNWSHGLNFVQMKKNTTYRNDIKQTPFEALFRAEMKFGLKTSNLPDSALSDITTEEDLETLMNVQEDQQTLIQPKKKKKKNVMPADSITLQARFPGNISEENVCDCNLFKIRDENQTNKMKNLSNRLLPAKIGDNVHIPISNVDKSKTDSRNLLCVVLDVDERQQYYKLGTKNGILKQSFIRNQFSICNQTFLKIDDVPDTEIFISEGAVKESLTGRHRFQTLMNVSETFTCSTVQEDQQTLIQPQQKNIENDEKTVMPADSITLQASSSSNIKKENVDNCNLFEIRDKNQTNKMKNLSNRLLPAKIGDNVHIPISKVDKSKTDSRNLLCVVLDVDERQQYYELGTKNGTLKQSFTRNQFSICKQTFLNIDDVPDTEIFISEGAVKESLTGRHRFQKCMCRFKCESSKCSCKTAKVLCNPKCHSSTTCSNK